MLASCAVYRDANREARNAYFKKYKQENNGRVAAGNKKRELAKKNRTPRWLTADDIWLMKEIYELSALRTKSTGVQWHVDHIIPLQGKKVSGLHVPTNLQIILGKDNIVKNNRFEGM